MIKIQYAQNSMWLTSISQIADASQNFDVFQLGMYVIHNLKSSFKIFKYNNESGESKKITAYVGIVLQLHEFLSEKIA